MGRPRVLSSVRNPRIVELARLHDARHRRARRRTLVEGPHLLADATAAGAEVVEIYALEGDEAGIGLAEPAGAPVTVVTPEVLRRIAATESPRGPVGVVAVPPSGTLRPVDTVVLWGVADPGNAGAIVRSAAAFGFAAAATRGTADLWSPKAVRAGAGGQFRTTIVELGSAPLDELRAVGLHPASAVLAGGSEPEGWNPAGPVAVIIGNEAHGVPSEVAEETVRLSIDLEAGVESLNAAVAAGVVLHALRRSRSVRLGRRESL